MTKILYGWVNQEGKWCISLFKPDSNRATMRYETKEEAMTEAQKRGMAVKWQ